VLQNDANFGIGALAAYTDVVLLGDEEIAPPTVDDIVAETREPTMGRWRSART
jgi:hypothetical protein